MNDSLERLPNESLRRDDVQNILEIAARARMSVSRTQKDVPFVV